MVWPSGVPSPAPNRRSFSTQPDWKRRCGCNCQKSCPCRCRCSCSCRCEDKCDSRCAGQGRILVVSIDGTSNHFGKKNTNVVELHSRIIKGPGQLSYYNSGIGTYAPPSAWTFGHWRRLVSSKVDLAIALRFERIVQRAYRWLTDHYEPGDSIFLFGFSRGAYQVRTLAGMIEKVVGLMYPGNIEQIPFAYNLYADQKFEGGDLAPHFKTTYSRDVKVHFVGAWDTVSSIGITRTVPLPLTETCDHICVVRHALALDERRVKFLPEYFRKTMPPSDEDTHLPKQDLPTEKNEVAHEGPKYLKEVWFAGCHSDIGGGAEENKDLNQAAIPLLWMENEARAAGLGLKRRNEIAWDWKKLRESKPTESLKWLWWVMEYLPIKRLTYRNINNAKGSLPHRGKGRMIMEGQHIHASVAFKDKHYAPKATLTDFDFKELVGTGKDNDSSWTERFEQILEMDLFDLSYIPKAISSLQTTSENGLYNLNRLAFTAASGGWCCHRSPPY
ncbi:hypothetical protein HETIRDRAFT_329764 [Heterobasidion irregulare TC 32-1]|uniref:T6SS Phospholipase effector Tle1-like catalytic domain-containing protein n=1 Tax=Heterobasidion irregulare (strain TC 32-1) TaxID=747525 RepID=W4JRL1_HETIT|nr:uncharacterized protein HETIRDRAFT_329764 [Heterobasidion irregulare TC 32-1]ETW76212.1 hypothetical protein HETIRDRAFT_329764 [Heterobasidion irregulare TC 32-1]